MAPRRARSNAVWVSRACRACARPATRATVCLARPSTSTGLAPWATSPGSAGGGRPPQVDPGAGLQQRAQPLARAPQAPAGRPERSPRPGWAGRRAAGSRRSCRSPAVEAREEPAGEPVVLREHLLRPRIPELFEKAGAVDEIDQQQGFDEDGRAGGGIAARHGRTWRQAERFNLHAWKRAGMVRLDRPVAACKTSETFNCDAIAPRSRPACPAGWISPSRR